MSSLQFHTLADIDLPQEFRRYEVTPGHFETFLLGDTEAVDPNRILAFGRAPTSSWIGTVEKLHVDGTFDVAPELFAQLTVILAERPGCVVPICYVLLPDKSETSYYEVRLRILLFI